MAAVPTRLVPQDLQQAPKHHHLGFLIVAMVYKKKKNVTTSANSHALLPLIIAGWDSRLKTFKDVCGTVNANLPPWPLDAL